MHTILSCPTLDHVSLRRLEGLIRSRPGFHPEIVTTDRLLSRCRNGNAKLAAVVLTEQHHDRTLDIIRQMREEWVGDLLVVGPATDPKLILRSMQAGADRFLDEDDLAPELDAALARLKTRWGDTESRGQLLAVLTAAGGCGASTIALNLAVLLAGARGRCNLIDLNLYKADLTSLLDLKPQYTIVDLCRNEERLDRTLYEKLLTRHPSGIELLAAPKQFSDIESVTAGGVAEAIGLARDSFKDVVVDLQNCVDDVQNVVLDQATQVFLVSRLDFIAVRNTRRILDHLVHQGMRRERIQIVVNKSGLPSDLSVDEAETAIGGELTRFIPYDPESIGWSNNTGVPAAVRDPKLDVVQAIARLVGLEEPAPSRAGLSRFFGARLQTAWKTLRNSKEIPDAIPSIEEMKTNHEPTLQQKHSALKPRACAV